MKRWLNWQKQMKRIVVFCILVAMAFSSMGSYVSAESFIQSPETEAIEIESLREPNAKHFQLPDGTMEYVVYGTRIHYSDGDGKYQEISSRIIEDPVTIQEEQYLYRNEANDIVIRFAESTENAEYPVYFSWEDKTIGIRFNGDSSTATQEYALPKFMQEANVLENMVIYPDVQPGIDYVYEATGSGLKESLIIRERQEQNEFSFEYCVNGLSMENTEKGFAFKNGDGEIIMESGHLYAYDDARTSTDNIQSELEELGEGNYRVTIRINQEWLNSDERSYPVIIDPNVYISGFHFTYDACICSDHTTTNYCWAEDLRSGRDDEYGKRRSLIRFKLNGCNLTSSQVNSAKIAIYRHSGTNPHLYARRITSTWSSETVTWNNQPGFTTTNQSGEAIAIGENWYSMTITAILKSWLSGTYSNYGVMLFDTNENSGDYQHWSTYYSSETTNLFKVPKLSVNYTASASLSYTGTFSGTNGYSVAVMQGNSTCATDTANYFYGFADNAYTVSSYGFDPILGTVINNRALENDFYNTGLSNDICVFSGHGSKSTSGPILNAYASGAVNGIDFNVANALGVANSTTSSSWSNADIEVLVLAACSQLHVDVVKYYARIMTNSGIRAITGYHEPSNDDPIDAIVAASFLSFATSDNNFSVKYSWEYANTYAVPNTEDWAILVYAVDPLYCMIGSNGYSPNHATGGTIYRYTNVSDYNGNIPLNNPSGGLLYSNNSTDALMYPLYLNTYNCIEVEKAYNTLGLDYREAVDPQIDLDDCRKEADHIAKKCIAIDKDSIIVSESKIIRDVVTVDGVLDDSAIIVGRNYSYQDSYKGVPIEDSFLRFSFDSEGVYMSRNHWKTYEPSLETILVTPEMEKTVINKCLNDGMIRDHIKVYLVYRNIAENLSKLYYKVTDGERTLWFDVEDLQS